MSYIPASGSVVAFQGNPSVLQTLTKVSNTTSEPIPIQAPLSGSLPVINVGSIISVTQGSIGAVIIGGSIASAGVANQSVSGTVGASVIGTVPITGVSSVGAASGVRPVLVGGRDINGNVQIAEMAPDGDFRVHQHSSYVTLADGISNQQNIVVDSDDTGYTTTTTAPYYFNGTTWDRVRGTAALGAYVNVTGSVATVGTAVANQSVSGAVSISNFPTTQNVSGSVVAFGFPTTQNVSGSVAAWLQSTNASVITVGSPVANQSVSGAVSISNFPTTQNVSGSVVTFPTGTQTVVSSLAGGIFPISGSVSAVITNTSINVSGSVANRIQSSNGSVITQFRNSSIIAINAGSVITINPGSIVTIEQKAATTSVYAVLSSITTVSVLNANAARKGATIYNDSGTNVYIKLGTAATTSVYTLDMADNSYYELPFGYTGVVAGITASNAGRINVTEISL